MGRHAESFTIRQQPARGEWLRGEWIRVGQDRSYLLLLSAAKSPSCGRGHCYCINLGFGEWAR